MTKARLLLGISLISLIYTGCGGEDAPKEVEKNLEVKKETKVVQQESIEVKEKILETKETMKEETVVPIVKKVQTIVSAPDVKTTFQKCSSCHGQKAEKKALNKSAIIKDWEVSKIEEALIGYKNGTYGGAMKGLMRSQVSSLSDKEIRDLSEYITTLNQ